MNMSISTKMKRERGRNFTDKEKEILIGIINQDKFRYILENRKLDHKSTQAKYQAWLDVTDLFNVKTGGDRPTTQLKTYYENYRVKCKKKTYEYETTQNEYDLLSKKDKAILLEIIKENSNIENNEYENDQLRKDTWGNITTQFNSRVLTQRDAFCLKKNYEHFIMNPKTDIENHELEDIKNENMFKKIKINESVEMHQLHKEHGYINKENFVSRTQNHTSSYNINDTIDYSSSINDISETQTDNTNDSTVEDCYEHNITKKFLHVSDNSNIDNYFILKTKLLEDEREYKRQEFENKQIEFQEKLKMFKIEKKIKESELKLKEIETEIKLEELKQLRNSNR